MSRTRPATGTRAFKVAVWRTFMPVQQDVLGEIEKGLAERHRPSVSEFDTLVNIPLGGIRLRELRKQVVLTQSAVSRLCDRLTDRGLLSRSPVADDARGATIRLTGAGRKLIRSAGRTNAEVVDRMFADRLSEAQLESLHEILASCTPGTTRKAANPPGEPAGCRGQPPSDVRSADWAAAPSQASRRWVTARSAASSSRCPSVCRARSARRMSRIAPGSAGRGRDRCGTGS